MLFNLLHLSGISVDNSSSILQIVGLDLQSLPITSDIDEASLRFYKTRLSVMILPRQTDRLAGTEPYRVQGCTQGRCNTMFYPRQFLLL
jgi:hypothetical protein